MEHGGPVGGEVHHALRPARQDGDGVERPEAVPTILDVDGRIALEQDHRLGHRPRVVRIDGPGARLRRPVNSPAPVMCAGHRPQLDPRDRATERNASGRSMASPRSAARLDDVDMIVIGSTIHLRSEAADATHLGPASGAVIRPGRVDRLRRP